MPFMSGRAPFPTAVALIGALLALPLVSVAGPKAQETFQSIHSFSNDGSRQSGGASPSGPMIQAPDGLFYGVATSGGKYGLGTLYRMAPTGATTTLISFNAQTGTAPRGPLTLGRDGMLYGVTSAGGNCDVCGTIFRLSKNGKFKVLHKMRRLEDGASPNGGLVQTADGSFYGAAYSGGEWGFGTVFRLSPDGKVQRQASFYGAFGAYSPRAGLLLASDGAMYGTGDGGLGGWGAVFRFEPGVGVTGNVSLDRYTGSAPASRLVEAPDGLLYGTTPYNGPNTDGGPGYGTIYRVSKQLNAVELFVSFDGTSGKRPYAGLALASDGNFYGSAAEGGDSNMGTLFRVTPGKQLSVMHTFRGYDGAFPIDEVMQGRDGLLRGTTNTGGLDDVGTVFTAVP